MGIGARPQSLGVVKAPIGRYCSRGIAGVALLKNRIYIVGMETNIVSVFKDCAPFDQLDDIAVEEMQDPQDIVACRETSRLYISDLECECIWRVNVSDDITTDKWISLDYSPYTLSVKSSRLLVTSRLHASLYLYDENGELLNRVISPAGFEAGHAVETDHFTIIFSCEVTFDNYVCADHFNHICEALMSTGEIIRDDRLDYAVICHLALKSNGDVLAADNKNDCVWLRTSDLGDERQLLNKT